MIHLRDIGAAWVGGQPVGGMWAGGEKVWGKPAAAVAPTFTTQPSLTGSTALGSTITVSLGAASGTPEPTLTGTLTRPGKAAAAVLNGAAFVIEAADQGGTITLDVTATNAAGSEPASAALEVPAAGPPVVANAVPDGYPGTTASITADGEITITNVENELSDPSLYVFHYMVKADNMLGKTLVVKRGTDKPNAHGSEMGEWQMAWSYDKDNGPWLPFDSVTATTWTVTAANSTPCTQNTVYVARRPVFTTARWDQAIARWKANPLTSPTASGNADFVIGNLPPVSGLAPAMPVYGFKIGTGPVAHVLTGNVHTGEHIGAYAMEACVDWLLSSDPKAVELRLKCTFFVYPKLNPQARYAGSQRSVLNPGTYTNSNDIWMPEDATNNAIPLSKVMRDAWKSDLPAQVESNFDFHDTAVNQGFGMTPQQGGAYLFYRVAASEYVGRLRARYFARAGIDISSEITAPSRTIGAYFQNVHAAGYTLAVEHQIGTAYGVPEWQEWGRDVGRAIYDHYGDNPEWIIPDWQSWSVNGTATKTNGEVTAFRSAGTPGVSIPIPEGKTIEIIIDVPSGGVNIAHYSLRHGAGSNLSGFAELHTGGSNGAAYRRRQQVTWDATKTHVGILGLAKNGTLDTSFKLSSMTRYRVLP